MKKFGFLFFLMLFFTQIKAQDSITAVTFQSTVHDFGIIQEVDGIAKCKFKFTNTGKDTLFIASVRVSCGCTSSDWSEKGIPPGVSSEVEITYNPHNRPGHFEKEITFIANTNPNRTLLKISGIVIPRPKTIREVYPQTIGNIWVSDVSKPMGIVYSGKEKTDTIFIYNSWNRTIKIQEIRTSSWLNIKFHTMKIQPGEKSYLTITYDATKQNEWGLLATKFSVVTTDSLIPIKEFEVYANIVEDFSLRTAEQKANAPKLKITNPVLDFGTKTTEMAVFVPLVIENTGKEDLYVRKIMNDNKFITVDAYNKPIKAGEKAQINIVVNLKGRSGKIDRIITLVTNDADNSYVEIHITGVVENY